MAADIAGPGNHFYKLPGPRKSHTARCASDENNTRRSNLIWKVIYINLKQLLSSKIDLQTLLNLDNIKAINGSDNKIDQLARYISRAYRYNKRKYSMEYVADPRSIDIPIKHW
jgi:hypothetical protein